MTKASSTPASWVLCVVLVLSAGYASAESDPDDVIAGRIKQIWPGGTAKYEQRRGSTGINHLVRRRTDIGTYFVNAGVIPEHMREQVRRENTKHAAEETAVELADLSDPALIGKPFVLPDASDNGTVLLKQGASFRCDAVEVLVTNIRDTGIDQFNWPGSGVLPEWNRTLVPDTRKIVLRAAEVLFPGGDCLGDLYAFYKEFLTARKNAFEFAEFYAKRRERAFFEYPAKRGAATRSAMERLIREGVDAPALLYARVEQRQNYRHFFKFVDNLGQGLGDPDAEIVRRFRRVPRQHEIIQAIDQKLNKKLSELILHVHGYAIKYASIPFQGLVDTDPNKIARDKIGKLYDTSKLANKLVDDKVKGSDKLLEALDWADAMIGIELGQALVKEFFFYWDIGPDLVNLTVTRSDATRDLETLERDFPAIQASYQRALLDAAAARLVLREFKKLWDTLSNKEGNRGRPPEAWRAGDRELGRKLVGGSRFERKQSALGQALDIYSTLHGIASRERDEYAVAWHLRGFSDQTPPPLELIP